MSDSDALERLLRAAGERPAVPVERLARARAAALEVWRETAAEYDRGREAERAAPAGADRRWFLAAAAILVVALAGRVLGPRLAGPDAPVTVAGGPVVVERVVGGALATPSADAGAERPLLAGATLDAPRAVVTAADGRVALRLASGHSVRLDHGSRLEWLGAARVRLDAGAVYVDSGAPAGASGALVVVTPYGEITETGTRYEIRLDAEAALTVRLRDGAVRLTGTPGAAGELIVEAGREVLVSADGSTIRRPIEPSDPAWSWAAATLPAFVLSGATLADFLAWAEVEHGLRFRYAAPDMPAAAAAIRLEGGALDGLSPDEALDVVLSTCGWTSRPGSRPGEYELAPAPA